MAKLALLFLALLQAPAGRLTLDGQAVALGTNAPVPHARIVVAKVGGAVTDYRTGVADANGRFGFRDLAAGNYRVFAERQGYLRGEHGRRAASGNGTPVWLVEGQATRITVTMIQTGAISGRVLDEGRPVRGVLVRALRASFFDGRRTLNNVEYTRSDDLGEYRLFGLAPGTYYVTAVPPDGPRIEGDTYVVPTVPSNANGNQRQTRTAAADALAKDLVDAAALDNRIFVPVFFPGTTDETAAAAIEVQSGRTATGIDLTVARSPIVRVRGRVVDAGTGQPVQNVSVGVAPQEGRIAIASSMVDASGSFDLAAVPPGRYDLVARTTTAVRLSGTVRIDVSDRNLENVTISMTPGTTVRGRVTFTGVPAGTPPPASFVQLNRMPNYTGYSVALQADGTFTMENVETGEYRTRIAAGRRGFLAPESARLGADDVTGRTFRVGPEHANMPLELVFNLASGGIDVIVTDASQRPVQGVTVALVPDAPQRNQSGRYRTASTDEFGKLRFDDVLVGDYRLFTEDVDPPTWQDPDVIRRFESRGTRVRVVDNARQTVTVRMR
jgi:hypothetical protein